MTKEERYELERPTLSQIKVAKEKESREAAKAIH